MIASSGSCSADSASLLITWRRIARLSWRVWSEMSASIWSSRAIAFSGLAAESCGADGRDQGPEQRGLMLAGAARDPDQPLQQDQQQRPGDRRRHARLPGDRQGDAEIDQRVEQHRRHLGAVLEGLGRALRLGGDGVRQPPDRLLQVVAPARRHDGADQRQAQVGEQSSNAMNPTRGRENRGLSRSKTNRGERNTIYYLLKLPRVAITTDIPGDWPTSSCVDHLGLYNKLV